MLAVYHIHILIPLGILSPLGPLIPLGTQIQAFSRGLCISRKFYSTLRIGIRVDKLLYISRKFYSILRIGIILNRNEHDY